MLKLNKPDLFLFALKNVDALQTLAKKLLEQLLLASVPAVTNRGLGCLKVNGPLWWSKPKPEHF